MVYRRRGASSGPEVAVLHGQRASAQALARAIAQNGLRDNVNLLLSEVDANPVTERCGVSP